MWQNLRGLNLPVQKFSERVAGFVFAHCCPFTDDDILYLDFCTHMGKR